MELRHLRYFVAVAEHGHVGRAATALLVAQPTLSQQLRDLEREIGTPLFVRHARGVTLSTAGEVFLPHAAAILEAVDMACDAARLHGTGAAGRLLVGLPETAPALSLARSAIQSMAATHPAIELVWSGLPWLLQPAALADRALDIGFCWTGGVSGEAAYPDGLTGLRLVDDPGEFALLADDHPLAAHASLTMEQLGDYPFALFDRALLPQLHDYLLRGLSRHGLVECRSAPGVTSATGSTGLLLASGGWTLVSRLVSQEALPGVVARRVHGVSIPAGIDVVWRQADERAAISVAIQALVTAARQLDINEPKANGQRATKA